MNHRQLARDIGLGRGIALGHSRGQGLLIAPQGILDLRGAGIDISQPLQDFHPGGMVAESLQKGGGGFIAGRSFLALACCSISCREQAQDHRLACGVTQFALDL